MGKLKVRKVGNSLSVTLPKDVAYSLKVEEGDHLYLSESAEGGYTLTPYDPEFEARMDKARDIMSRYRNTLRALAK
ncbi:MAG: AbrB/MazE/SpoVT family DNA-binding domain-containing protein [Alphaproteobacteria bacterium]